MTTAEQIALVVDEDKASHPLSWASEQEPLDVAESVISLHDMLERFGYWRVFNWFCRLRELERVDQQQMDQARRG